MLTRMNELVTKLEEISKELNLEVDPLLFATSETGLQINLDFYFKLKKIKELAGNLEGLFNKNDGALSERISKQIEVLGIDSLVKEIDDQAYTVKIENKVYCNVNKENKAAFIEFMENHPIGRELVKKEVHHKTLESFVVDSLIGNGELPPPCISMHTALTLGTRKKAK